MAKEFEISKAIQDLSGSGKTFAEFLAHLLKDRYIEVYLGDAYESVTVDQISTAYPAVICGKIVGAYRECLIINTAIINKNKQLGLGNILFINERAIRALKEIDGNGILEEALLRSKDSHVIKEHFIDKGQ